MYCLRYFSRLSKDTSKMEVRNEEGEQEEKIKPPPIPIKKKMKIRP